MKNKYIAIISFILLGNVGFAQPTSFIFSDNASISIFFSGYPNVTSLDYVGLGPCVTNTSGLSNLTAIGTLEIQSSCIDCVTPPYNSSFVDLSGLNNVTSIGTLTIASECSLSGLNNVQTISNGLLIDCDFNGLNGLTTITGSPGGGDKTLGLVIRANVSGLSNLTTVNGTISISSSKVNSITSFPNLTTVTGEVDIYQTSLNTINSFNTLDSTSQRLVITNNESLTTIYGFNQQLTADTLWIGENPNLITINAFSGLQTINKDFRIFDNPKLQIITGFGSLTNVAEYGFYRNGSQHLPNTPLLKNVSDKVFIQQNPFLLDLSGLNGLTLINNSFALTDNNALTTLAYLGNLTTVNSINISRCNLLTNFSGTANPKLDGLNNLTTVSDIVIENNAALNSLSGLENIKGSEITFLGINANPLLTTCAIKSVCDKIALQNGNVFISNNSTDCNSVEEVANTCSTLKTSTIELYEEKFKIYPNPMNKILNIENSGDEKIKQVTLYNSLGQVVYRVSDESLVNTLAINVAKLQSGIYLAEIISVKGRAIRKVIKD